MRPYLPHDGLDRALLYPMVPDGPFRPRRGNARRLLHCPECNRVVPGRVVDCETPAGPDTDTDTGDEFQVDCVVCGETTDANHLLMTIR